MTAPIRTHPTMNKETARTARAWCEDCLSSWDKPNALAPAAIHARAYGHRVSGWLTVEATYDGRPA